MPEPAAIAITAILFTLVIVGIVGNSLVCSIIKTNRNMRTPTNYLLLNLAVADVLYMMFIVPNLLFVRLSLVHHPGGLTGTVLCKLLTSGQIGWVGAITSIVTLAVIAVERYYAVVHPLGNKGKLTKRELKVIVPSVWILSIILNIPPVLVCYFDRENNSCGHIWPREWMAKVYQNLKWNTIITLTMLVMFMLYSKIVYNLWFKQNDDNQLTHQQKGVLRARKRVTMMAVTVSVIFGICWGTHLIVYNLRSSEFHNNDHVTKAIANTLVLFNSAGNPFVYALLNQQYREKMKKMICCRGSSAPKVHPTREPQHMQIGNVSTNPTRTEKACSQE